MPLNLDSDYIKKAENAWYALNNNAYGFGLKELSRLLVAERAIPLSTLYQFLDFTFEGWLPGGGRTNLPLITEEEIYLWVRPYSSWAPGHFKQLNYTPQDRLLEVTGRDEFHVNMPRKVHAMKARLWEGMIPISGGRWKEKRLDDLANSQDVFEILFEIMWTFQALGDPIVQRMIRDAFNAVSKELLDLQTAMNNRRTERGIESLNLTALWTEFIRAHFDTMTTRTHSWALDRYNEMLNEWKAEFDANFAADGTEELYEVAKKFSDKTQDLMKIITKLDYFLFMPMTGFEGFDPNSATTFSQESLESRDASYYGKADKLPWEAYHRMHANKYSGYRTRRAVLDLFTQGRTERDKLRREFRGEPKRLGDPKWISLLKSRTKWSVEHGGPRNQTWGFVAYRLDYTHIPEEWEHFVKLLNEDFRRCGEWTVGAEDIRYNAGLQWLNGQELGIPEGDIQAAKRHFQTFAQTDTIKRRMWKTDFLIADVECVDYYLSQASRPETANLKPFGDYGGYIKLVDGAPSQLERDRQLIGTGAPGYDGHVKVLASLVFDDVYPLITSMAQRPRDFWPQAVLHPMQVYVGPTTPGQESEWEMMRLLKRDYLTQSFQFLK